MRYLLDTNVLLRIAQPNHPMNREARECVRFTASEEGYNSGHSAGDVRVLGCRDAAHNNNGLGLTPDNVRRKLEKAESFFELLPDTAAIYHEWLRLVQTYWVAGVEAHDARIVAVMKVHAVTHLVTFNQDDFKRFNKPEVSVLAPAEVISAAKSR